MRKSNRITRQRKKLVRKKLRTIGLVLLTLSLTAISLKAQYIFWRELFGVETGLLAASVFEVIRISALYLMIRYKGVKRITFSALYLVISLFFGAIGFAHWHSELLMIDHQEEVLKHQEYAGEIDIVKKAYATKQNEQIKSLEGEIKYIDNLLAKNPGSAYWARRRDQYVSLRDEKIKERDTFLAEKVEDFEGWLEAKKALVDVELDQVTVEQSRYQAIQESVMSIFGLSTQRVRKILALSFVVFIEISIVLLTFISGEGRVLDPSEMKKESVLTYLMQYYSPEDIEQFALKSGGLYLSKCEIPLASEITPRLRPLRQMILENGFSAKEIEAFFKLFNGPQRKMLPH
ncbi:hypothetical protein BVY01_05255 [bacterium I07]|nr:hypothetical protein BVY01_05255 [bacterium I07]